MQVELLLERTALRDGRDEAGDSFLDQLAEIVNQGENSDKEVTELASPNTFLDSLLDFEGGSEETRSSFGGESIFDRAEKKAVFSSDTFDQESIFFGLESTEDKPALPSSDKFLNSLISLLVEKTNIEEDFSDYVDNQVGEHNGGRAVIQLREEDYPDIFEEENYPDIFEENYPDIFDTAGTAGNFDGILNGKAADSGLVVAREESPVRGKSFIEEEQEATQDDVEETANQLARLLSDIEGVHLLLHAFVPSEDFFTFSFAQAILYSHKKGSSCKKCLNNADLNLFAADRLEEARLKETVLATIR